MPLEKKLLRCSLSDALSSAAKYPKQLHQVHTLLITLGLHKIAFFSGKLISKYALFKHPSSSLSVFDEVHPTTNIYLWNSIIRALTYNGLFPKALEFYSRMRKMGLKPDRYTFPSVTNACAASLDFEMGDVVHEHVLELGFGFDLYIGNALVDMYARFGDLARARKVFDEMPQRDVVSWNSLISGYSAHQCWEEALDVYYQARKAGLRVDSFTVSSILPACGGLVAVDEGELLHGFIEKNGMNADVIVSNGLLSMYLKFDRVMDAQRVFDEMVVRDNVSWNTLICGYFHMELYEESIRLFMAMVGAFRPDSLTVTSVLRACGQVRDLEFVKFVHEYLSKYEMERDITASNVLIDTYAKCGDLVASKEIFDSMKHRDPVSWNSLVQGYIQSGMYAEGVELFKIMKTDSEPDAVTYLILIPMLTHLIDVDVGMSIHCDITKLGWDSDLVVSNALIDMYAKCGKICDSLNLFENMRVRDIVTWNTIISASIQAEDSSLGFRVINRMRNEVVLPDVATMLGILPICSFLAAKWQGKEIHTCIFKLGFESLIPIGNALIEMYAKCGNLKNSIQVFDHMKHKDVVTWTALISAYGLYGEGKKSLRAFEEMEAAGIVPDHVAYVSIIYACSHSGLVEEGLACFERMKEVYKIEPRIEHYSCVVDLLSRSGRLSEAEDFISSMPIKADASVFGALLSACRASKDLEIIERVSQRVIQLDPEDAGYFVLLSNIYAVLGKWDQVRMIRKSIKARGLKKDPGCSWIEIRKIVYAFCTGDRSFEQHEKVNKLLGELAHLMAKEGYVADLQYSPHNVNDDEKRDLLCGHSERLAIAFGLLNTEPGSSLQIMKNLRVCSDCHTWTKQISKIAQREILVRDANRFHIFKHGTCSCGDHW